MKKNNKAQKLVLGTQTVRTLSRTLQLQQAAGGQVGTWVDGSGNADCVCKSTEKACG